MRSNIYIKHNVLDILLQTIGGCPRCIALASAKRKRAREHEEKKMPKKSKVLSGNVKKREFALFSSLCLITLEGRFQSPQPLGMEKSKSLGCPDPPALPGCPLSSSACSLLAAQFRLTSPGCPVPPALSLLSSSAYLLLAAQFLLPSPGCTVSSTYPLLAVQFRLPSPGCTVPPALSKLSSSACLLIAVQFRLHSFDCPVPLALSCLAVQF
jgi:hypothetical protein